MRPAATDIPLCVDLDGTLVRTDMLRETMWSMVNGNPLLAFVAPFWLLGGRACLKQQVARRAKVDMTRIPFHEDLLAYLRDQRNRGRRLVLATASDSLVAARIAEHTGFFSDVLSSDGSVNLKGKEKLQVLLEKYGDRKFDYAGNSQADIPLWQHCNRAILVNVSDRLLETVRAMAVIDRVFK